MSIRIMTADGWRKADNFKRFNGSQWMNVSSACRRDDGHWIDIYQPSGSFTRSYPLTQYASYTMISGARILNAPQYNGAAALMQGSPNGSLMNIASTMMFFPVRTIRSDLHDAVLTSATLHLQCVGAGYYGTPCSLLLHYGNGCTECPASWDGSDSGDADNDTPDVIYPGTADYNVRNSVIEGMLDGSVTFLSLNAASCPETRYYLLFDAASAVLTLSYTR